jgi:hypothetical protein
VATIDPLGAISSNTAVPNNLNTGAIN